jgi:hypothetical protein
MKNFIISKEERNRILEMHSPKKILIEQAQYLYLRRFFGGNVDDLFKMFSDDAVKSLDDVFAKIIKNPKNIYVRGSEYYLKSASGMEIPVKDIQDMVSAVAQGKRDAASISKFLPRNLADGSEFRNIITSALETRGAKVVSSQAAGRALGQFETKFLLNKCFSRRACDWINIENSFLKKISNTAKLTKFNPAKVKILERTTVSGREIINVSLEDGSQVLFYKSSGANVATTGKEAGEWFVIPGFADDGWFFKTEETVELTKGGNKYLTDMANFLKQNGINALGK